MGWECLRDATAKFLPTKWTPKTNESFIGGTFMATLHCDCGQQKLKPDPNTRALYTKTLDNQPSANLTWLRSAQTKTRKAADDRPTTMEWERP